MSITIISIIGIVIFIIFFWIVLNNSLVAKKNQVDNAFSSIDVQLLQRYDLIPNLVEATKSYMQHEQSVLTKLTELRAKAMSGSLSTDDKIQLNNELGRTLGAFNIAVENYPDLKASDNFIMLQRSLNEVEAQITAARRSFNAAVTDYNDALEMFPSNIIAQSKGYQRKNVIEIEAHERKNISIKNLMNS
jgi:LemA protein